MPARIPAIPEPVPALSPLELRVLQAAVQGENLDATAWRMSYSVSYVTRVRSRAIRKLEAGSIGEAIAAAFRYGLLH